MTRAKKSFLLEPSSTRILPDSVAAHDRPAMAATGIAAVLVEVVVAVAGEGHLYHVKRDQDLEMPA